MTEITRYRFSTVRHVLEYYMENKGFDAVNWRGLASMTKVFIDVMGKKKLVDLQPEHFNAYISGRKRGAFGSRPAKSGGTLRKELTHLKTAISFCLRSKLIDPTHVPFIPLPDAPPPKDRWLSKEEIAACRAAVTPFSRGDTFLRIALATGARKRSIETLEWSQVNFQTNMITFEKEGRQRTKKRRPTVPIQSDLRVYLEQLKRQAKSDYVMGTTACAKGVVAGIARRAGVKGLTPHVFRHTWATHASMNGVPMGEIARILGDSIVTVERVYAKFQPGYLTTAIEQAVL